MASRVVPEGRRLNFRSTHELIARRRRLRQGIATTLALLVGLGALLVEF